MQQVLALSTPCLALFGFFLNQPQFFSNDSFQFSALNPHHQGLNYPKGRIARGLGRQNRLRGLGSIFNSPHLKINIVLIAKCNAPSTKIRAIFCV